MWPSHTKADKNGSYEIVGCSNVDCFIEPTTDEYLPYEEAVQRWNTRLAPAATDTGLVTIGYGSPGSLQMVMDGQMDHASVTSTSGGVFTEPVCFRSQAEELLAAKDAEIEFLKRVVADQETQIVKQSTLEAKLAAAEKALETKSAANEALSKSVVESIDTERHLREALRNLYQGYVNTMEAGRDRILSFGGNCDPVDVMEKSDPVLIEARAALGGKPS